MYSTVLIFGVCLAAAPAAESESKANALVLYQQAKAEVGRDADSHVRLALWCEMYGLKSERIKHLTIAILTDPAHAAAHGLLGMVKFRERWQTPAEIRDKLQEDDAHRAALAEYAVRRARMGNSADAHWKIAMWCERHGLKPQATAHLSVVTQKVPSHEAAWKRLGYKKDGSRYVTDLQLTKEKAEADARTKAHKYWMTVLTRLRRRLADETNRNESARALEAITDPAAARSVWVIFADGDTSLQKLAVQLFGQIDSADSTRALAALAITSESGEVRGRSIETLRRREPREIASFLIEHLLDPWLDTDPILYHYAFYPIGWDDIGSPGVLWVEGPQYNVMKTYTVEESRLFVAGEIVPTVAANYPTRVMTQRNRQTSDLATIIGQIINESAGYLSGAKRHVEKVDERNARIIRTLVMTTGQNLGGDREVWRRWWTEEKGYAYESPLAPPRQDLTRRYFKPTYEDNIHLTSSSCFAAGTPVETLTGPRAIESVQIGDQVLSQDPGSGALSYQSVIAAVHNKPAALLKIELGHDVIQATGIHRFWQPGRGWVMARDLKPGDSLRALGGVVEVKSVTQGQVEPVYNLKLMQGQSFFVGQQGLLVHDNSAVEPVPQPFDLAPAFAGDYWVDGLKRSETR